MHLSQTLLSEMIALPSVNPMGSEPDENSFESRMTGYLASRCERSGVPFRRDEIEPGRENFVAWLAAASDDPVIVFEAHQDTVPIDGMTIPPFSPEVRDGRMYGRGACDVKGGLAAMLAALEQLAADGSNRATIVLACSINEEFGGSGAQQLAELWQAGNEFPFDRSPDAVIVAEPTELDVVAAHKGTVRWRIRADGIAAHSSTPDLGCNAIYRMAKAVIELERYAASVLPTLANDAELGPPTLSVGVIQGGASVNIVPESCWIEIDRRLTPGEEPESAWRHVADYLDARECEVVCEQPYLASRPLTSAHNTAVVERIIQAASSCGQVSTRQTAAYCSDASRFADFPTVVFGPGDIAQAHTCDEWIDLQQLELAEKILLEIARRG